MSGAVKLESTTKVLCATETDDGAVLESNQFGDPAQEEQSTQRCGQGGDQQSVIASRRDAGDRVRGITAEAIGDEPFAAEQQFGSGTLKPAPRHASKHCPRSSIRFPAWERGYNVLGQVRHSSAEPGNVLPADSRPLYSRLASNRPARMIVTCDRKQDECRRTWQYPARVEIDRRHTAAIVTRVLARPAQLPLAVCCGCQQWLRHRAEFQVHSQVHQQ